MNPERTLFSLVAIGLTSAGYLYGDYWKKKGVPKERAEPQNQAELVRENDGLRDEIAQLRSLLSGTPLPIPEDLISFVEKDLGLAFKKPPTAELASPADFRDTVEQNLNLVYGQDGLGTMERTWELLGLLPAGQNLLSQWIVIETVGARGIFDLTTGKILLAEDYQAGSIQETGVLVRLLVRQLLAQNSPKTSWSSEDEWNAWLGTTRGAAINVEARYLRRRGEPASIDRAREDILSVLPSAVQGLANFPYLEGHDFVESHYLKSRSALLQILQNPAQATLTIIRPDHPAPPQRPVSIAQNGQSTNRIGALGLRLLLDPILGMDRASRFAAEWRSDEYLYDQDRLRWHLKLGSTELTEELHSLFEKEALPILRKTQPERTIEISYEGSRFTFINSPKNP